LLDVAIRRARRFGRGGKITEYEYQDPDHSPVHDLAIIAGFYKHRDPNDLPILDPELSDVRRILDVFEKLGSSLHEVLRAEGLNYKNYRVNPELLPLDLQIALKKATETAITAILNTIRYYAEWGEAPIGALLIACDPRPVEIGASVATQWKTVYSIHYSCRSHIDGEFETWIWFRVYRDELGRSMRIDGSIYWMR
jgi:hypothetical protein